MPTLPLNWDQDHFRNMIYSHYNSERVRWWQAMPDVSYSSATGNSSSPSGKKWNRVEVTNISQYRCIIYHSRQMQMTGRYGRIPSNEITVTFMADEFQFSYDDFIMPIGVTDYNLTSPPDYPTITLKESVLRGWKQTAGVGSITSNGNVVTGMGTTFTTSFVPGMIISAANQQYRILSISSDTSLTTESAPSPAWINNSYNICTEPLQYSPIANVQAVADSVNIYNYGADYIISSDQTQILWNNPLHSPAPGMNYSIIYDISPIYVVIDDLGTKMHNVNGEKLISSVRCKLWIPENDDL